MQAPSDLHPVLLPGWTFAEAVRAELLGTLRRLTPAGWTFGRDAKAWCAGEVAEHLLHSEIGTSKMVRKLIRGDYRSLEIPRDARLYTVDLDRYPFDRLDAPANLTQGPVRERVEVEQELQGAHQRLRSELSRFQGDHPDVLRSPDPATGVWFTMGGWLKLQAWHEAHHIRQIQRLEAHPSFPSGT